jgi:hypothetical protein
MRWAIFFNYISYLLDNQLSSLQERQNNMVYSSQCLLLNTKKTQQCHIQKLDQSFFLNFDQGTFRNEHEYVTKLAQKC